MNYTFKFKKKQKNTHRFIFSLLADYLLGKNLAIAQKYCLA